MQYTSDLLNEIAEAGYLEAINCNIPTTKDKRQSRKFRERNAR